MGYSDADVSVYVDVLGLLYVVPGKKVMQHLPIPSVGYTGLGHALVYS